MLSSLVKYSARSYATRVARSADPTKSIERLLVAAINKSEMMESDELIRVGTIVDIQKGGSLIVDGLHGAPAGSRFVEIFSKGNKDKFLGYGMVLTLEKNYSRIAPLTQHHGPALNMYNIGDTVELSPYPNAFMYFNPDEKIDSKVLTPLGTDVFNPEVSWTEESKLKRIKTFSKPMLVNREKTGNDLLQTDIALIDWLHPIGRGSRTIFSGSQSTRDARVQTALDVATRHSLLSENASESDKPHLIWASVGHDLTSIKRFSEKLENEFKGKGNGSWTIVASTRSDSAAMRYLTPHAALAIAESINRIKNQDCIFVLDNANEYAKTNTEMNIISGGMPVFSPSAVGNFLERCGKFKNGRAITGITLLDTNNDTIVSHMENSEVLREFFLGTSDNELTFLDKKAYMEKTKLARVMNNKITTLSGIDPLESAAVKKMSRYQTHATWMREILGLVQSRLSLLRSTEQDAKLAFQIAKIRKQDEDDAVGHLLVEAQLIRYYFQSMTQYPTEKIILHMILIGEGAFYEMNSTKELDSYIKKFNDMVDTHKIDKKKTGSDISTLLEDYRASKLPLSKLIAVVRNEMKKLD